MESAVALNDIMGVDPIPSVEEARWVADYTAIVESGTHETTNGQLLRKNLIELYGPDHAVLRDADQLIRFQAFKLARPSVAK